MQDLKGKSATLYWHHLMFPWHFWYASRILLTKNFNLLLLTRDKNVMHKLYFFSGSIIFLFSFFFFWINFLDFLIFFVCLVQHFLLFQYLSVYLLFILYFESELPLDSVQNFRSSILSFIINIIFFPFLENLRNASVIFGHAA